MKLIILLLLLLLITNIAKADYLFSTSVKYGPNGYNASGFSTSSSTIQIVNKNKSNSSSSSSNDLSVNNRIQSVLGFKLQNVPEKGNLSLGIGYYLDNTVESSIGIRF